MLRILIFTLVFISSNLIIKKSFGDNNTSEFGNLQHNVCEECKFLNGQGLLRFFGLKIYQATLFSEYKSGEIFNSKFFLRIKYFRDFKGKDIAKISFKEMHRLNLIAKEKESVWLAWMEENIPDIKKDDVLKGVYVPEEGIVLHHNENVVATLSDKDFCKIFFFNLATRKHLEPKLRQKLLEFRKMVKFLPLLSYSFVGFILSISALPLYIATPSIYAGLGQTIFVTGMMLMIIRLVDAFTDPVFGSLIDKTTGHRFLRWLNPSLIILASSVFFLFNPPEFLIKNSTLVFFWFFIFTLIVSISNGIANIAYQSWAFAWSSQTETRNKLISGREVFVLIGLIVSSVLIALESFAVLSLIIFLAL